MACADVIDDASWDALPEGVHRWLPEMSLPSYRYVPGRHPHPFRHRTGHAWCGGGPPEALRVASDWRQSLAWLRGVDLFNHRFLWEAHEVWEGGWHQHPRHSPESALLQGMIHAAAALLLTRLGRGGAAERQAAACTLRLERAVSGGTTRGLLEPDRFAQRVAGAVRGEAWPYARLGAGG